MFTSKTTTKKKKPGDNSKLVISGECGSSNDTTITGEDLANSKYILNQKTSIQTADMRISGTAEVYALGSASSNVILGDTSSAYNSAIENNVAIGKAAMSSIVGSHNIVATSNPDINSGAIGDENIILSNDISSGATINNSIIVSNKPIATDVDLSNKIIVSSGNDAVINHDLITGKTVIGLSDVSDLNETNSDVLINGSVTTEGILSIGTALQIDSIGDNQIVARDPITNELEVIDFEQVVNMQIAYDNTPLGAYDNKYIDLLDGGNTGAVIYRVDGSLEGEYVFGFMDSNTNQLLSFFDAQGKFSAKNLELTSLQGADQNSNYYPLVKDSFNQVVSTSPYNIVAKVSHLLADIADIDPSDVANQPEVANGLINTRVLEYKHSDPNDPHGGPDSIIVSPHTYYHKDNDGVGSSVDAAYVAGYQADFNNVATNEITVFNQETQSFSNRRLPISASGVDSNSLLEGDCLFTKPSLEKIVMSQKINGVMTQVQEWTTNIIDSPLSFMDSYNGTTQLTGSGASLPVLPDLNTSGQSYLVNTDGVVNGGVISDIDPTPQPEQAVLSGDIIVSNGYHWVVVSRQNGILNSTFLNLRNIDGSLSSPVTGDKDSITSYQGGVFAEEMNHGTSLIVAGNNTENNFSLHTRNTPQSNTFKEIIVKTPVEGNPGFVHDHKLYTNQNSNNQFYDHNARISNTSFRSQFISPNGNIQLYFGALQEGEADANIRACNEYTWNASYVVPEITLELLSYPLNSIDIGYEYSQTFYVILNTTDSTQDSVIPLHLLIPEGYTAHIDEFFPIEIDMSLRKTYVFKIVFANDEYNATRKLYISEETNSVLSKFYNQESKYIINYSLTSTEPLEIDLTNKSFIEVQYDYFAPATEMHIVLKGKPNKDVRLDLKAPAEGNQSPSHYVFFHIPNEAEYVLEVLDTAITIIGSTIQTTSYFIQTKSWGPIDGLYVHKYIVGGFGDDEMISNSTKDIEQDNRLSELERGALPNKSAITWDNTSPITINGLSNTTSRIYVVNVTEPGHILDVTLDVTGLNVSKNVSGEFIIYKSGTSTAIVGFNFNVIGAANYTCINQPPATLPYTTTGGNGQMLIRYSQNNDSLMVEFVYSLSEPICSHQEAHRFFNSEDFNDYTVPGDYSINVDVLTITDGFPAYINRPTSANFGVLSVSGALTGSSSTFLQHTFKDINGTIITRARNSTTWTEWVTMLDSNDLNVSFRGDSQVTWTIYDFLDYFYTSHFKGAGGSGKVLNSVLQYRYNFDSPILNLVDSYTGANYTIDLVACKIKLQGVSTIQSETPPDWQTNAISPINFILEFEVFNGGETSSNIRDWGTIRVTGDNGGAAPLSINVQKVLTTANIISYSHNKGYKSINAGTSYNLNVYTETASRFKLTASGNFVLNVIGTKAQMDANPNISQEFTFLVYNSTGANISVSLNSTGMTGFGSVLEYLETPVSGNFNKNIPAGAYGKYILTFNPNGTGIVIQGEGGQVFNNVP